MTHLQKSPGLSIHQIPSELIAGEIRSGDANYLVVMLGQGTPEPILLASREGIYPKIELAGAHYALIRTVDASEEIARLLTERELEITVRVAQGKPNKQIGGDLGISEWTVATHLRRIFAKLQVSSRAEMVYRCSGLIGRFADAEGGCVAHRR